MLENIKKISIIGGPGTGKSTLADNLGKELDIPVCHLDGINYFPNWVRRDEEERDRIFLEKINEDRWILDGTYTSTLEERIKKSDMVIFLDYSTMARIKGTFKRILKHGGKEKEEIPGCKEQMTFEFFKFIIKWKQKRWMIIEKLKSSGNNNIMIFKTRKELNKWYEKEFGKKIKAK